MSIIFGMIIIVIGVTLMAIIINGVEEYNKFSHAIPFKESIDLINVPIVTFVNNNVKLHFLLDTGSDSSYIRGDIIDKLSVKSRCGEKASIYTGGGEITSEGIAILNISYKNHVYEEEFEVADVTKVWDNVTKEIGITVHGVLGSRFFERYKYQIDFENLIAYSKK